MHIRNLLKPILLAGLITGIVNQVSAQLTTFGYTGSVQSYTVPAGVTNLCIDAQGAAGGMGYDGSVADSGGKGGRVECNLAVTAGQVLSIYVGGAGLTGSFSTMGVAGGYNGGAASAYVIAGSGGGATDIRIGGTALTNRVVVAGGGGGGGSGTPPIAGHERGGSGGGLIAGNGYFTNIDTGTSVGHGGSQTAGGIGGHYSMIAPNGTLGTGGTGGSGGYSGGGGGGYYGGGGGSFSGGGGGSSYTDPLLVSFYTHTMGYRAGNGILSINTTGCLSGISGTDTVCESSMAPLTNTYLTGIWSSSNPSVATIGSSSGIISGVSVGLTTISYTDGSHYVSKSKTVKTCPTLGISGSTTSFVEIYPNPANEALTLNTSAADYTNFAISNSIGKQLIAGTITTKQMNIDISTLPSGIYLIDLRGASGSQVLKFVKQN